MSDHTKELFTIVDALPDSEKNLIDEPVRRVIIAWDPDFTKPTPEEIAVLRRSEQERQTGEVFSDGEISRD